MISHLFYTIWFFQWKWAFAQVIKDVIIPRNDVISTHITIWLDLSEITNMILKIMISTDYPCITDNNSYYYYACIHHIRISNCLHFYFMMTICISWVVYPISVQELLTFLNNRLIIISDNIHVHVHVHVGGITRIINIQHSISINTLSIIRTLSCHGNV